MEPLFKKRVTAYIGKTEFWTHDYKDGIRIRWPMSKLLIFKDYLIVKVLHEEYKINFKDIECIDMGLAGVRINHANPKIDKYIYVKGLRGTFPLFMKLMKIIKENKLKIKIANPFLDEKKVRKKS